MPTGYSDAVCVCEDHHRRAWAEEANALDPSVFMNLHETIIEDILTELAPGNRLSHQKIGT